MRVQERPIQTTLLFFCACFLVRFIECFFIKTDRTPIGELVLHKLFGIALLVITMRLFHYPWADIGFSRKAAGRGLFTGAVMAGGAYGAAYISEIAVHVFSGASPALRFFVSGIDSSGELVMRREIHFVLICIAGNIINALMTEGVFMGLFLFRLNRSLPFIVSAFFSSFLFGLWTGMEPLRNMLEGNGSVSGGIQAVIFMIAAAFLFGFLLCLTARLTGSLWAGIAIQFINNAAVNLLHIRASGVFDAYQMMRISIAQAVLMLFTLVLLLKNYHIAFGTEKPGKPPITAAFIERYGITNREREVIEAVLQKKSNKEIADSLCVTLSTIEAHLSSIYRKTEAGNRFALYTLLKE